MPATLPLGRQVARLGVVLTAAVALGYGLFYFVEAVDRLHDNARANSALNFDDREFAGGNALVGVNEPLYEARALIAENETYRIVAGPNVEGATELTEPYVDQFARYFLMPRRPSPEARWIICYGCDPATLGGDLEIVWRTEAGVLIARAPE